MSPGPDGRRYTRTYIVDSGTTATDCWEDEDSYDTWPIYYVTSTYDEPEPEAEELIIWSTIWIQIAYAIIFKILIEQRNRGPPNLKLRRHASMALKGE